MLYKLGFQRVSLMFQKSNSAKHFGCSQNQIALLMLKPKMVFWARAFFLIFVLILIWELFWLLTLANWPYLFYCSEIGKLWFRVSYSKPRFVMCSAQISLWNPVTVYNSVQRCNFGTVQAQFRYDLEFVLCFKFFSFSTVMLLLIGALFCLVNWRFITYLHTKCWVKCMNRNLSLFYLETSWLQVCDTVISLWSENFWRIGVVSATLQLAHQMFGKIP